MGTALLFPHTRISESDLKRMKKQFESIDICQPWFMQSPVAEAVSVDMSCVKIHYPPDSLKPKGDFQKLMSEYKTWLSQNQDKGYAAFLSARQKKALSEDASWEIRQLVSRTMAKNAATSREAEAFKWHMILHLGREFEENRLAAESLLEDLKCQKSPLDGALEDSPPERFFADTPLMETRLRVDAFHLDQVLEAWFGLFGNLVTDGASLVTLDPKVLAHAEALFESSEKIINLKKEAFTDPGLAFKLGLPADHVLRFPEPVTPPGGRLDPIKKGLCGKTLILVA